MLLARGLALAETEVIALQRVAHAGAPLQERLERGAILLFPRTPLDLTEDELRSLLGQRQTRAGYHKNVAYRPGQDRLTGTGRGSDTDALRAIMRRFSDAAAALVARVLPRYAAAWRLDFASFRPQEEEGRSLSLHSRNDLLHVDAFPTRPTNGDRILRFFTNIHPSRPRVWVTSDPFDVLAERFAREPSLAETLEPPSAVSRAASWLGRAVGLPKRRPAYDSFMLAFHHFLKENESFQATCPKYRIEFPAGSSWLVFTDTVSHSVLAGQYALEQTFIVSRRTLCRPDLSPAGVLERIHGRPVTLA